MTALNVRDRTSPRQSRRPQPPGAIWRAFDCSRTFRQTWPSRATFRIRDFPSALQQQRENPGGCGVWFHRGEPRHSAMGRGSEAKDLRAHRHDLSGLRRFRRGPAGRGLLWLRAGKRDFGAVDPRLVGPCAGDSGGGAARPPAERAGSKLPILVGLNSRSVLDHTAPCGDGAIYTLLDAEAVSWIENTTAGW